MMNQRKVTGSVLKLWCAACGKVFPHFRFSGEDDTDTAGLYSMTSCDRDELVVAAMDPSEWNGFEQNGAHEYESRIGRHLHRDDLNLVKLLRIESPPVSGSGVSFHDFRKTYIAPAEIFSCPCCETGESTIVEELTIDQFKELGGKITVVGSLAVSNNWGRSKIT